MKTFVVIFMFAQLLDAQAFATKDALVKGDKVIAGTLTGKVEKIFGRSIQVKFDNSAGEGIVDIRDLGKAIPGDHWVSNGQHALYGQITGKVIQVYDNHTAIFKADHTGIRYVPYTYDLIVGN